MIKIEKKKILADYTTFKIGGPADYFVVVKTLSDLLEAWQWAKDRKKSILFLGGGSNSLISDKGFSGLVIKNEINGLEEPQEHKNYILLTAKSGEWWSSLVNYAVERGCYGAENLFLIPGTVGAAPIQNIGAYGVELKDIFYELQAFNLHTGKMEKFNNAACQFAYRQSIFKRKLKGKYFIYSVTLKLSRVPDFHLDYGDIKQVLGEKNIVRPTARQLVDAIMQIRNSKLPNPAQIPNAGSFFQNPEVSWAKLKRLQAKFPEIKSFPSKNGAKLAAGWLIEQCGFKGKPEGAVSAYEKQALILVNLGGAQAKDVLKLAKKITLAVQKKFGVKLIPEVNYIK